MKRYSRLAVYGLMIRSTFAVLGVVTLLSAFALGERVPGAGLVEASGTVEEVLMDLAKLPLEKNEIEWFLRDSETVLLWAEDNVELWLKADESDEPLEVVRSFSIWEEVDSASSELIATLAKLLFLSEFMQEPDQLKGLKNEITQMKQAVDTGRLSGYVEEMAHREIKKKQQFVDILEAAGARNLKLYMANQERIDPILDRFGQIGE